MTIPHQICNRCIMDTSDPKISFDAKGICTHCARFDQRARTILITKDEKRRRLGSLVNKIKTSGQNKPYDCVIGLSGGIDSTYLAYQVKSLGLRPIAVHLDNGWNSELSVANIESVVKKLNIDLITRVLNWQDFRDLQLAFLEASTPDSEIPTDHAIYAVLLEVAHKQGVRYILSGTNFSTESVMPFSWSNGHRDWRYIRGIHKRFGKRSKALEQYPHFSFLEYAYFRIIKGIRFVSFLNLLDYKKEEAITLIQEKLGWRNYGGKHYESNYTKFYQGYLLPHKFGFDKRRAHLSSLILSGQVSREAALVEIKKAAYPENELQRDLEFVAKKLELNFEQLQGILAKPKKTFEDYDSYEKSCWYRIIFKIAENLKYGKAL